MADAASDMEPASNSYAHNLPPQQQPWPGREDSMRPQADHGEETYKGSGKLVGKKALITGGDSGIGRAVAIAFAREGADLAIAYYNEHDDADVTLHWVQKAGRKGVKIPADISDVRECRRIVNEAADALGGLDIIVNNAAIHVEQEKLTDITPEQLERTYRTNIFSQIWITQEALKYLHDGSCIINTGSVVALQGHKTLLDYAGTKAAIHNFTKSLAMELADKHIRVNAVAPGPVWTPLIPSTRSPESVEGFGKDTFWGRPAQPAELAPSYVFLASSDSNYYTGEIFAPTGMKGATR